LRTAAGRCLRRSKKSRQKIWKWCKMFTSNRNYP
jgi:hypothetical protein